MSMKTEIKRKKLNKSAITIFSDFGIKTFRDLKVWQKAMTLVNKVHDATNYFPDSDQNPLSNQLKASCIAIPSLIAEGFRLKEIDEFAEFLNQAIGHLYAVQTQIEIAVNLEYMKREWFNVLYEDCRELERLLSNMIFKLE
jgi:four helix bundle protein